MPGDTTDIPVNLPDQQVIIEAFRANQWPTPQLATIKNGSLTLHNTKKPILMSAKKVTTIKITPTTLTDVRALPVQPLSMQSSHQTSSQTRKQSASSTTPEQSPK